MTAQDLKNSILQLAVQGKLVPQDPSDEPASELLKRITSFRTEAIKNGTLSIDKKHTADPIAEDDIPYDLPPSWEWVRFADIVTFSSGKTPARQDVENWSDGVYPWVSISDMVADDVTLDTKEKVSAKAISESFSGKLSPIGTMIMSFKLTIGKMSILGIDAVHNEAIISIFPTVEPQDENTIKAYLFKILPLIAVTGNYKNAIKGKTLNATSISNLMIPLPPIAEQERIVAKIEELMPLVEEYGKTEERIKALNAEFPDKLRKSILREAVQGKLIKQCNEEGSSARIFQKLKKHHGKIKPCKSELNLSAMNFEIPSSWMMVELNQLFDFVDYRGKTPNKISEGVFLITASNIKRAYMDYSRKEYISVQEYAERQSRGITELGDLLFTTEAPMGNAALCDLEECSCGQRVITFKEYEKETVVPALFMYFILSPQFQQQLLDNCTGATAKGIKADKLKHLLIPLPPFEEQKRIVTRVEELLAVCDGLK